MNKQSQDLCIVPIPVCVIWCQTYISFFVIRNTFGSTQRLPTANHSHSAIRLVV